MGNLAIASASWRAIEATAEREAVLEATASAEGLRPILLASEQIASERALVNSLYMTPEPASGEVLDPLLLARAQTDAALATVTTDFGSMTLINLSLSQLDVARDQVLSSLALAVARRPYAINQQFADASAEVQAAVNLLADQREREAGRAHARLVQVVALARLSQALREAAGMRSAHLERAISSAEVSRDTYRAIDELGGRVDALWDRIVVGTAQLSGAPRLDDAREEMRRTLMGEGRATYDAIAAALRDRRAAPVTLDEFRAWTEPMLERALLMRDAAFDVAGELATDMTREATLSLWVAVSTAISALLASLGAASIILWRVVRPLGELTEAVARLSRGDLAVNVPGRARRDELGAMACAVDMFKQSEAKISWMARHDSLTRLPNRSLLQERIQEGLAGLAHGPGCALLLLDLDGFKDVNDTLGHPLGDQLLRVTAQRVEGCVRSGDTVARLGGDEFAVMQASLDGPDAANRLAGRLVAAMAQPFVLEGREVRIGTSIGVAIAAPGVDADGLIRQADTALYAAKGGGRGIHRVYEPAMSRHLQERRKLQDELRAALDAGSFELHYQPIVDLTSDRINGFEALLRWRDPSGGLVSPSVFIPVAEEIGLIRRLGAWALREACVEASRWPAETRVAVNLSPVQFEGDGLVPAVTSALSFAGLPARRLELEVTESVLLRDAEHTRTQLEELRALGVRICLDDFGTGYSSLSYLHKFPFDKIKIDKSFVCDLPGRDSAAAIVGAIAGIGASLRLSTTAEGVETEDQLAAVRASGCTEAQGYLLGRPASPAEVLALMHGTQPTSRRTSRSAGITSLTEPNYA